MSKGQILYIHNEIQFNEKKHEYIFEGVKLTSGTQFIGKFHEPFNRDEVLNRKTDCPFDRTNIKAKWEISSPVGTAIHEHLETLTNNVKGSMIETYEKNKHKIALQYREQVEKGCRLVDMFIDDYEIVGTEVRITNGKIAGTIDLLMYNLETDKYLLLDYKTCVNIDKAHYGKSFDEPMGEIMASKHDKYSMQLSLYSAILEDNYDIEVEGMYLLWIPLEKEEELIKCSDYRDVIRRVL